MEAGSRPRYLRGVSRNGANDPASATLPDYTYYNVSVLATAPQFPYKTYRYTKRQKVIFSQPFHFLPRAVISKSSRTISGIGSFLVWASRIKEKKIFFVSLLFFYFVYLCICFYRLKFDRTTRQNYANSR